MKSALLIGVGVALALAIAPPHAAAGPLARFTHADGAISVLAQGDFVDPYFANKALIVAWEAGLDVSEITRNWLAWLLPRQRADGGFDRFCVDKATWRACKGADADDSTAATFLHLNALYSQAVQRKKHLQKTSATHPAERTAELLASAALKAGHLLQRLRTSPGTYRAFADKPIEFLMDNTEVYASLMATGQHPQAAQLKQALQKQFFANPDWRPANEPYAQFEFYPSALAQTYRWHTGLTARDALEPEFEAWTKKWGTAWLTRTHDEYAWGLIAWGARSVAAQHWIRCWRHKYSVPDRSRGWTVIDEAVDEGLAHLGVEPIAQSCEAVLDKK
jgi:hypothetical protein